MVEVCTLVLVIGHCNVNCDLKPSRRIRLCQPLGVASTMYMYTECPGFHTEWGRGALGYPLQRISLWMVSANDSLSHDLQPIRVPRSGLIPRLILQNPLIDDLTNLLEPHIQRAHLPSQCLTSLPTRERSGWRNLPYRSH